MFQDKKIGIIGVKGSFGSWLERFFQRQNCAVVGSDVDTVMTNDDVVRWADVVIFAVPLSKMTAVIRELVPRGKKSQLWMDIGSLKTDIVAAMLESKAEVIGLHPLFAAPAANTWKDQTLVFTSARLREWGKWVDSFLAATEATIVQTAPALHDRLMLFEQNIPQAAIMALAMTLAGSEVTPTDLVTYSTVASRKVLSLIASLLANTPQVYADIQVGNPDGLRAIDALILSLQRIRNYAAVQYPEGIVTILDELRKHYGEDFIAAGKRGFV